MKRGSVRRCAIALSVGIALAGCGRRGDGGGAAGVPPPAAPAVPVLPVVSPVQRVEVIATLTLSALTQAKLRRSNKNPSLIRAQLVRYRNLAERSSWESVELANAPHADARVVATPFLILRAQMRNLRPGRETRYGYVLVSDITTRTASRTYLAQEIGAFLLRDNVVDLCAGAYDDLCYFDSDRTRPDFRIHARIQ